jgi:glycerol-3-phosphate dehydrogenase
MAGLVATMNRPLTTFDRGTALERLASESFDVLVIGGGITGAGVALDAAARGLRTALIERADFASGTSSKSSKLIHGGLRYLQQREFGLVHENLVERHRLLRNAPHLVEPLTFLIPLFGKGGVVDQSIVKGYSIALWLYDLGGGWRIGRRHKKVSAEEIYRHLPTLARGKVVAGFLYYDARADDARLTLAIIRTAALEHGAVAANYVAATGLRTDSSGRICAATVVPLLAGEPGESFEIKAGVVVNATGVWADEVRSLEGGVPRDELRPAKGIHLTVRRSKLPCDTAAVVPAGQDKRTIFVVPWGDFTYLGTTDTDYEGPLEDPAVTTADVDYVLAAINAAVSEPLTRADVTATWAGLRPLLAASPHRRAPSARTADLSRRHRVIVSEEGLVTITGGKLTTYRKMAEDTVDAVAKVLERKIVSSPTKRLKLRGAATPSASTVASLAVAAGLEPSVVSSLVARYGGEAPAVVGLIERQASLAQRLVPSLPYLAAEAVYACRYEMAERLEDVLARRTRALLLDAAASRSSAAAIADLMAGELGWDPRRTEAELALVDGLVEGELAAVRPPSGREDPAIGA